MVEFRPFEEVVIGKLTAGVLDPSIVAAVKTAGELVEYYTTGVGYFFTVRHPELPVERVVCHLPPMNGESEGVETGFVIFLENRELTLECYGIFDKDVPRDYRDREVRVFEC